MKREADPTKTTFNWEIFLLAGDNAGATLEDGSAVPENHIGNIKGDIFSSPDGIWFDFDGRLWVQTDYGDDDERNFNMGHQPDAVLRPCRCSNEAFSGWAKRVLKSPV